MKLRNSSLLMGALIGVMLLLTGCGKETFEVSKVYFNDKSSKGVLLTQTAPAEVTDLQAPSEEYSNIYRRTLPQGMSGEICKFINYKEMEKSYHHLQFTFEETADSLLELEWKGIPELGNLAAYTGSTLVLADTQDDIRLYIKQMVGEAVEEEQVRSLKQEDWTAMADAALPYVKDGYFEKQETGDGCHILFAVESEAWKGYVVLQYDYAEQVAYQFLYSERADIYKEDRAFATAKSISVVLPEITQISFEDCFEVDAVCDRIYASEYLQGSPYHLAACTFDLDSLMLNEIGVSVLQIHHRDEVYEVAIEKRDTLAPKVEKKQHFFWPGDTLDARAVQEQLIITDNSQPVRVEFKGTEEVLVLQEDMLDMACQIPIELSITDKQGNCTEYTLRLDIIDKNILPEWYSLFYERAEVSEETNARGYWLKEALREGMHVEEFQKQYMEQRYQEVYGNEAEAVEGFYWALHAGLNLEVDEGIYGDSLLEFYAALDRLPEAVKQRYIDDNWKLVLTDESLALKYRSGYAVSGITVFDEQLIEIEEYAKDGAVVGASTVHEMGHFLDGALSDISETEEFTALLEQVKADIGITDEYIQEYWDVSMRQAVMTAQERKADNERAKAEMPEFYNLVRECTRLYNEGKGYRFYSVTTAQEFFAESFYLYCCYPDNLKANFPTVYRYMEECIASLNAEN